MQVRSQHFKDNVKVALANKDLKKALSKAKSGFIDKRANAIKVVPEFDAIRDYCVQLKNHTLANLDKYLEEYEKNVIAAGGHVHWAESPEDAQRIIVEICQQANAKTVTKGKSMAGEEVGVNDALEAAGLEPIETDLGEYIIQLAKEPPSHIIAPAVHKTKEQISDLFHEHHEQYGFTTRLTEVPDLVNEARQVLRSKFINADVGITGANFLIAESGTNVIVTNEGNGDLTHTLPRVHIVTAGLEKVVPTLNDAMSLLRLLGRSATGQEITSYTTFSTGPRRQEDLDGPDEYHVVLIDNGRTQMLANEFKEMLRCIRCGACMNHCPVYGSIGGHAYGWVYPGPMGSVLSPAILGLEQTGDLPNACTLNGRCGEVCPVRIPLPDMLRTLRSKQWEKRLTPPVARWALKAWANAAKRPRLYRFITKSANLFMRVLSQKGRISIMPMADAWTSVRDLPAPSAKTFMQQYKGKKS